ncbi:hypothetical protein [Stenotrophomonas maltophilia]
MIHIHPIRLRSNLDVYIELVPNKSRPRSGFRPLVADESRPLESVLLRFHHGPALIQAVAWLDVFTSDPTAAGIRSVSSTALQLADGTCITTAELMWLHGAVSAIMPAYDLHARQVYYPRCA